MTTRLGEHPTETHEVVSDADVVRVRQAVRTQAVAAKLSLIDQTKLVTATSELARNTVTHGRGGFMEMGVVEDGLRRCVRLTFEDQGPGIENLDLAMTDGWTSGGGLGLGLTGSKRLCNEFELHTVPGKGTRVTIARWT